MLIATPGFSFIVYKTSLMEEMHYYASSSNDRNRQNRIQ